MPIYIHHVHTINNNEGVVVESCLRSISFFLSAFFNQSSSAGRGEKRKKEEILSVGVFLARKSGGWYPVAVLIIIKRPMVVVLVWIIEPNCTIVLIKGSNKESVCI